GWRHTLHSLSGCARIAALLETVLMRLLLVCLLAFLTGCTVTRDITVTARPPGARISIDSVQVSQNPWSGPITFESDDDTHNFTAELSGYKPQTVQLRKDDPRTNITITLQKQTRAFTINVKPVPATIKING